MAAAGGRMRCGMKPLLLLPPASGQAAPRTPLPPLPEKILQGWRFDETNWWTTPHPAPLARHHLETVESWSGYALRVSGEPALLSYPLINPGGRTNLSVTTGALRFWFAPEWSSAGAGGLVQARRRTCLKPARGPTRQRRVGGRSVSMPKAPRSTSPRTAVGKRWQSSRPRLPGARGSGIKSPSPGRRRARYFTSTGSAWRKAAALRSRPFLHSMA